MVAKCCAPPLWRLLFYILRWRPEGLMFFTDLIIWQKCSPRKGSGFLCLCSVSGSHPFPLARLALGSKGHPAQGQPSPALLQCRKLGKRGYFLLIRLRHHSGNSRESRCLLTAEPLCLLFKKVHCPQNSRGSRFLCWTGFWWNFPHAGKCAFSTLSVFNIYISELF